MRTASQSFFSHSATPWSPRGQQIPANEPMSEDELVLGAVEQNPRQFASLVARPPLTQVVCIA